MLLYSLYRIGGTARIEAAVLANKWTQYNLVEPDQKDHYAAHNSTIFCQCCPREFKHCLFSALTTPCLDTTTRSRPVRRGLFSLKLSRIRRLIRFLSTARRLFFLETAMPKRAQPILLGLASTRNNLSEERFPLLKTRPYSSGLRSLQLRGNPSSDMGKELNIRALCRRGLWRDVPSAPCGHCELPCAHEIHGCGPFLEYWVERFFS